MSNSENDYGAELSAVEDALVTVVLEAKTSAFTTSSEFARKNATMVAMAASQQLITTKVHANVYGKAWLPTVLGLKMLSEVELDEEDLKQEWR